jgi:hypothetical protein
MEGGGEGGIREVEKDDGDSFYERGESLEIGRVKFTVEFTVHRGAAEVLGSEG